MNQHPRVRECVGGSLQFELGLAHFHSLAFSEIENGSRFVDARYQLVDTRAHRARSREAFVARGVAVDTQGALLRSNHLVARFCNRVVAMTSDAFAKLLLIESLFVRAGLEQFGLTRVALATNVCYRSDAGRRGSMVSMT